MNKDSEFDSRQNAPEATGHEQQAEARRLDEKQRRIALYQVFKDSPLHPSLERIYYPGCGDDDSVVDAFAESEIHLVDIDADCVRELRQKSTSPRLHIVEASAVEYDPGPVDVLVLHGPDHEMQMNTCLNTVIEGGFILSGDDSGTKLRDELINRSDLELAGIVCSSTTPDSDSITSANTAIRKKLGRTLQEFHFKKGEKENVTLVETDEEFKTATPKLYGLAQNQWRATKEFCKNQKIPDSILEFTKMMKSISIPPKQPGAALWIFRKVSQGME